MKDEFKGEAISLNTSARPVYLTICLIFITALFVYSDGWAAAVTKSFLIAAIISLLFSVWFPYSPFVKIQVRFTSNLIQAGKEKIIPKNIEKIICRAYGNMIEFHLYNRKEAVQIRMEDEFQRDARDYLKNWSEARFINFIEKEID